MKRLVFFSLLALVLAGCVFRVQAGPVLLYVEVQDVVTPTPETLEATPTPVPTAIPEIVCSARVIASEGINVRAGPGTSYAILQRFTSGTTFPVQAGGGEWWQLSAATGWVNGAWVRIGCP